MHALGKYSRHLGGAVVKARAAFFRKARLCAQPKLVPPLPAPRSPLTTDRHCLKGWSRTLLLLPGHSANLWASPLGGLAGVPQLSLPSDPLWCPPASLINTPPQCQVRLGQQRGDEVGLGVCLPSEGRHLLQVIVTARGARTHQHGHFCAGICKTSPIFKI